MISTTALLLNLAFACILGAALAQKPQIRRSLIAASATLFGVRAIIGPIDIITLVWTSIILIVCLLLLWQPFVRDASVRFTPEETELRAAIFDALPASAARHLMTQGWWVNGAEGETLTRQGKPIESLVFLASGGARVLLDDRPVGTCVPGDLIGEATALTGMPATATVVLQAPSRLWCIKSATLRDYIAAHPDIGSALERSFRIALRAKLLASNQAMASNRPPE
ncbi:MULTISPECIES: cyclic nucleotide-binding domain-containing protein [unclassified Sphingomonas]|uniref:cyclic nucleotide-binding domain-containing protein n=1 Tax=unclassified Sphingomonas TaxID=196159 RepID=UPI000BC5C463|nr:MAG: hypothetical protein B7Y98_04260 [Sphingomonas sp. 32-62-10]